MLPATLPKRWLRSSARLPPPRSPRVKRRNWRSSSRLSSGRLRRVNSTSGYGVSRNGRIAVATAVLAHDDDDAVAGVPAAIGQTQVSGRGRARKGLRLRSVVARRECPVLG